MLDHGLILCLTFEDQQAVFHSSYIPFYIPTAMHKGSSSPYSCQLVIFLFRIITMLIRTKQHLCVVLIFVSLVTKDAEHFVSHVVPFLVLSSK